MESAERGDTPVIDFDVLQEEFEGDDEFVNDLFRMFLENSWPLVAQIEADLAAGELKTAYEELHRLKGSIGYIRGERALETIRVLERHCRDGALDAARRDWPPARAALEELRGRIVQHLG